MSHVSSFLYVDDTTLLDFPDVNTAARHITERKTVVNFQNLQIGDDFGVLSGRAEEIGMRINAKKTQLLIIGPRNG